VCVCVGVRWILKNLGDDLTEADIDDMIADVDTDGSGWVDYNGLNSLHALSYLFTPTGVAGVRFPVAFVCLSVCLFIRMIILLQYAT